MLGFKRRKLTERQPTEKTNWHRRQRHLDTVVFVHGILGDSGKTWGGFPDLLDTDPDLPRLDLLSWGYRSGLMPRSYQDVETEGDALVSDLESLVRDGNEIFLVGHSMGGLVLLKGLVNRIRNQHGRKHPVTGVKRIVLYASPLHGSAVANIVRFTLGLSRWVRLLARVWPENQLRALERGNFCDDLVGEVTNLIYRPLPANPLVLGPIPVRACAAKHDRLVARSSAISVFRDPAPKILEADHVSIKLPDHHGDARYLALKNDLEEALSQSFHTLCREAMADSDITVRRRAAARLDERYGEMVARCAGHCFPGQAITDDILMEVAGVVWKTGTVGPVRPAQVVAQVIRDYVYKDDKRLSDR